MNSSRNPSTALPTSNWSQKKKKKQEKRREEIPILCVQWSRVIYNKRVEMDWIFHRWPGPRRLGPEYASLMENGDARNHSKST